MYLVTALYPVALSCLGHSRKSQQEDRPTLPHIRDIFGEELSRSPPSMPNDSPPVLLATLSVDEEERQHPLHRDRSFTLPDRLVGPGSQIATASPYLSHPRTPLQPTPSTLYRLSGTAVPFLPSRPQQSRSEYNKDQGAHFPGHPKTPSFNVPSTRYPQHSQRNTLPPSWLSGLTEPLGSDEISLRGGSNPMSGRFNSYSGEDFHSTSLSSRATRFQHQSYISSNVYHHNARSKPYTEGKRTPVLRHRESDPERGYGSMPQVMISTDTNSMSQYTDDERTVVTWHQQPVPMRASTADPLEAEGSGTVPTSFKHECDFCGKGFSRPSSLRIHRNSHTGEKPFVCPMENCGRGFSVRSNLRRHAKVHAQSLLAKQELSSEEGSDRQPSPASNSSLNQAQNTPAVSPEYALHSRRGSNASSNSSHHTPSPDRQGRPEKRIRRHLKQS